MHELSIALSIVELAGEHAARCAARVRAIHLRIGPLSGVAPAALQSAYALASEQTELEGSRLEIEHVAPIVRCAECGLRPAKGLQRICSGCRRPAAELVAGDELEVVALEVDA